MAQSQREGHDWCLASPAPGSWTRFQKAGQRKRAEASWPRLLAFFPSRAVWSSGPDNLIGASMFVAQILDAHSLAVAFVKLSVSTFHKKWWQFLRQDASSLFAALIQATHCLQVCSHLIPPLAVTCWGSVTPNCSSVSCLLKGVSCPTACFPDTHLMRCAARLGWGERTTNFHPGLTKSSNHFFPGTWNLLPFSWNVSNKSSILLSFGSWKQIKSSWHTREGHYCTKFIPRQSRGGRVSDCTDLKTLADGDGKRECHLLRQHMLVSSLITSFLGQHSRWNPWAFDL